ncbi:MAG: addiction module protein [Lentisphaerota bacterium]
MSVEYKISAMEALWEAPCKNAVNIASPEWHKDILKEREKKLKSGSDSLLDWEDAKKQIRDKIQHGQELARKAKNRH